MEDRRSLRLGVVWCLTMPEDNTDGKHIQYLEPTADNQRRFRSCDPELYDALARIVRDHDRSVARIERDGILPAGTRFFSRILDFRGIPRLPGCPDPPAVDARSRAELKAAWVQEALERTAGCDFVFFDPDNGLPAAMRSDARRGPKFTFYEDLDPFVRRGQTVVVYQHANR